MRHHGTIAIGLGRTDLLEGVVLVLLVHLNELLSGYDLLHSKTELLTSAARTKNEVVVTHVSGLFLVHRLSAFEIAETEAEDLK